MKFVTRSLLVLLALYGVLFAVGDAWLASEHAGMWIAVAFALGIVGLQFLCGPFLIEWLLTIHFIDLDDRADKLLWNLPDETNQFIRQVCERRGLRQPKIGIIQSGTPNAFAFGWTPSHARLVITTGLIDVLTPDELNAVVAHELGHIEHWDFVVMAIASLVPLLLYQAYIFMRGNNNTRLVAFGAYACYLASQFVVLSLNRTREYFADHYSACVTEAPGRLSSALVKIACGMVRADGEVARAVEDHDKTAKRDALRHQRVAGTIAVLGISNLRSGAALALAGADPAAAARVMRWDLVNPWARIYQLQSTHPLTARRVQALNREAEARHQAAPYPLFDAERLQWGAVPLQVVLWAAPVVAAIGLGAWWSVARSLERYGIVMPAGLTPRVLIFIGVTWLVRVLYRYRGTPETATIGSLIEDVTVSEMNPRAVRLQGEILGRGLPGAFWSPDLVIQDRTGLLFVLYRQSIPFARLFFALTAAQDFVGRTVAIEGWFRRGMRPYIEMSRIEMLPDGATYRAYSRWIQLALAAACVAIGWALR